MPGDSDEVRVQKVTLTLAAVIVTVLSVIWVGTYLALGLPVSAAIPFGYQVASVVSLVAFARTKDYRLFRFSQIVLMLLLPFLLQWSLGGYVASSAVSLWALVGVFGALFFYSARQAVPWFVAFVALTVLSGFADPLISTSPGGHPGGRQVAFFVLNIVGVSLTAYLLLQYSVRARDAALAQSDGLLLNVLPRSIAERLKRDPGVIAERYEEVTVLFADVADFTPFAERTSPERVVGVLDEIFSAFDGLTQRRGLEKIKTIGDAYMVVGRTAGAAPGPRRGGGGAGPRDAGRARPRVRGARARTRDPDRDRQRTRGGRRDRPPQVHLRPVGRHREHGEPDGVARRRRPDPGDRGDLPAPPRSVPLRGPRRDRGQGQGPPPDVSPGRAKKRRAYQKSKMKNKHEAQKLNRGGGKGPEPGRGRQGRPRPPTRPPPDRRGAAGRRDQPQRAGPPGGRGGGGTRDRTPQLEPVTREALRARARSGEVTILDVRPREEYLAGHIPGALSVPLEELEELLTRLPPEAEIVAYCRGPYCVLAPQGVALLRNHGHSARRLADGFPEWRLAGLPIAVGPAAGTLT